MKILNVDHIQITVPVGMVDQARHFYCETLKLVEVEKPAALQTNGGFWVQAGGMPVHIGVEEGVDRRQTKAHIAYRVTDLEAWKTYLHDKGLEPTANTPIPGAERIMFRDPFGNRVELIEWGEE